MKKSLILLLFALISSCQDITLLDEAQRLSEDRSQSSNCPALAGVPNLEANEEWIEVPANAGGLGLCPFYVMKFEAKAYIVATDSIDTSGDPPLSGRLAVSVPEGPPWNHRFPGQYAQKCEEKGEGFRLISNIEWNAIARDLERQDQNWTGQSVGLGCLQRGNSGESTVGVGSSLGDSCGYDVPGWFDTNDVSVRDDRAKMLLSNGEEIWDFAGNIWEFIDWDRLTPGYQSNPSNCAGANFDSISCPAIESNTYLPIDTTKTYEDGYGYFFGTAGGTSIVTIRGGGALSIDGSGVFSIYWFGVDETEANAMAGFRCVYSP